MTVSRKVFNAFPFLVFNCFNGNMQLLRNLLIFQFRPALESRNIFLSVQQAIRR